MRICKQCNMEFTPKRVGGRHKGIFCSLKCSTESRLVIKGCERCGTVFNPKRSDVKYCSDDCRTLSVSGKGNASWRGGKEERGCVVCGSKFHEFPSVIRKTCSKECAAVTPRSLYGENNPNFKGGRESKCAECGAPNPYHNKAYCSKECFHKSDFASRDAKRWKPGSRWGMKGSKVGKREDIGIFVRSSWEANYARYLNWLLVHGQIAGWEYEKETFEFVGIKRGTRFYTPDFKVELNDKSFEYHEVKGWMHPKGKTALSRMEKYHPQIKIVLIQKNEYQAIARSMKGFIPTWE